MNFGHPENIEYFMESAGVRYNYARVVDVSEIERVRFLIEKRVRKYCMTSYINEGKDMR